MSNHQSMKLTFAAVALSLSIYSVAHADPASAKPKAPQTELTSEFVYKYLVGEIAAQRGDVGLAGSLFFDLARSSRDPRLAQRATQAALYSNNPKGAIQSAALWTELDPNSTEAQQASVQILVSVGDLIAAKPYLQKLLVKPETRADGFLYLNGLLARQADKAGVLNLIQDLAKPYPELPEAHLTIANAAVQAGKNELAFSELDIADKLRPGWEISAELRGQVTYIQSPSAAVDFYRNFLTKYPNANEVRLTLARLLVDQKRFDEAKAEFIKLVKSSDNNPDVLVVVGLLSVQSGDYTEGGKYLQQALDAGFKDPEQIYLALGQIAEKQQKPDVALDWYSKVGTGAHYLDAKLSIAGILARTKSTDAAIKMLDGLQNLTNEQLVIVIQAEASLLSQEKRYQEAYELLGKATASLPNSDGLIYDYAMAAERVEQLDVTEQELRKLIQIKPDSSPAYNALGYTYADRNIKLDEARKLIEKALALSPDDHYVMDSMGWVQYRLGNLDKAVEYLRLAYASQTDPEIAAHLGEVLWQQGKHDEAMKVWRDALHDYPENEVLVNTAKKFKL